MARSISAFLESLLSHFDRLNEREKKLVTIFGIASFLLIVGGGLLAFNASLNAKREQLESIQNRLGKILSLKSEYQEAKRKQEAEEKRFRSNEISLFSLIQTEATRYGLTLYDLNEKKEPVGESKLMQTDVVVNLKEVSVDRLTAFIAALEETQGGVVKITRLKIKARYDKSDTLDVQMTVSTWKTV